MLGLPVVIASGSTRAGRGFQAWSQFLHSGGKGTTPSGEDLAQRRGEARVLVLGADGHPQRALAPERCAGSDEHLAPGQAADDLRLLDSVRKPEPDEVRVRLGHPRSELA